MPPSEPNASDGRTLAWTALVAGIVLGLLGAAAIGAAEAEKQQHLAIDFWQHVGIGFGLGVGIAVTFTVLNKLIGWIDYVKSLLQSKDSGNAGA